MAAELVIDSKKKESYTDNSKIETVIPEKYKKKDVDSDRKTQKYYEGLQQKTTEFVYSVINKENRDHSHGLEHFEKVVRNSMEIISGEKIQSIRITYLASFIAWLHDIADHKYDKNGINKKKLEEFLRSNFLSEDANLILFAIDTAGYSNQIKEEKKGNLGKWFSSMSEDQKLLRDILSDADKLEAIGKIGKERCVEYIRYKYKKDFGKEISFDELYDKVYEHSQEKLLRLKDHYIYTKTGKALAEPLHKEFVEELEKMRKLVSPKSLLKYYDALNIEGCRPGVLAGKNVIWCNLVSVLDCPLRTKVNFDALSKERDEKKYMLLESTIEEINENQIIASQLMVVIHYILNGYKYLNGKISYKIAIHFHQDKKIWRFIRLFDQYIRNLLKDVPIKINSNLNDSVEMINFHAARSIKKTVTLYYHSDDPYFTSLLDQKFKYQSDIDFLISLSQCAGIGKSIQDGELLYPTKFIPFNADTNEVLESKTEIAKNHFQTFLKDVDLTLANNIVQFVNANYKSDNIAKENKNHKCKLMKENDFKEISILVADKIWLPADAGSQTY